MPSEKELIYGKRPSKEKDGNPNRLVGGSIGSLIGKFF